MASLTEKTSLQSRVIKTELVNWREFAFIQQDDFKDLSSEARSKLKASILSNNFTQPFYVWQDPESGQLYCLDGRHRSLILEELIVEGYDIPYLLPATFIHCKDKTEGARLVLIYSSMYAKITQQGLFDFIKAYEMDYSQLKIEVDLPDFSTDRFEQKFDLFQVADQDDYEEELPAPEDVIVRPGDIFALGAHRLYCGSFQDRLAVSQLLLGDKARILLTDPPYNLPANVFTNSEQKRFENFAVAAGEMSDEEFSAFLEAIMRLAIEHSVPGAIHFIFMDWRHSWHMTEAGRRAYGSPMPKQVCVWVKDHMANGSFYRSQQELCFVFSTQAAKNLWHRDLLDERGFYKDNDELVFIFKNGEAAKHLSHLSLEDRIRTNVWRYPSGNSTKNPDRYLLKDHPTPKPVAMLADAILDTTDPGDLVLDYFLGSGSTLIAAEKTGRRCAGTEIDPGFVQTIVKRYIQYCRKNGLEPQLRHCNGSLTVNDFCHADSIAHHPAKAPAYE